MPKHGPKGDPHGKRMPKKMPPKKMPPKKMPRRMMDDETPGKRRKARR